MLTTAIDTRQESSSAISKWGKTLLGTLKRSPEKIQQAERAKEIHEIQKKAIQFAVNEVLSRYQEISKIFSAVYWIKCSSDYGTIWAIRLPPEKTPIPFSLDANIDFGENFWPIFKESLRNDNLPNRRTEITSYGSKVTTYTKGKYPVKLVSVHFTRTSEPFLKNELWSGLNKHGEGSVIPYSFLYRYPRYTFVREAWNKTLNSLKISQYVSEELYKKALACNKSFEDYDLVVAEQDSVIDAHKPNREMVAFQTSLVDLLVKAFKEIEKFQSIYNFMLMLGSAEDKDMVNRASLIINAAALAVIHVSQEHEIGDCADLSAWSMRRVKAINFDM